MLHQQVIEPCMSPYCSPIVLTKRKNGEPRFCIDFRGLNAITEDVTQALPLIPDVIKEFGDSVVFTTLDLKNGYWQVPLDPDSRNYTAFAAPDGGTYRFKVMPFGLKTATNTFQTLMAQIVLQGLLNECCLVYLDDVIIFSKNWKKHLHHLSLVLERLTIHGLACSLDKCCFVKREVQYLGHLVSANKNSTQDSQIKAIQEASSPSSKRELQRFLGICGWVREYVAGYSEITAPLTNLLRKHTGKWRWTAEAEEAFPRLKN